MKTHLILLLASFSACTGDVVRKEQLTGRYVFQIDNQDTLDVNSDGTYVNYKWCGSRRLENSGTWIYDSINGAIVFQNFSFSTHTAQFRDSTFVPIGNWVTRINLTDNEIHFIYATDISKRYFFSWTPLTERNQIKPEPTTQWAT